MKIEIYRKHNVCGLYNGLYNIEEDKPDTVFCNVHQIQITPKFIYGNIDGEQLTIKTDNYNYNYHIMEEA